MAGLDKKTPYPTKIELHQHSRRLEISFDNGECFSLSCEYLRVFTPSAEAKGHGLGKETLQTGKREVNIEHIEPVGNYAIRPYFSDGHHTGLYSWDLLYQLGKHQDTLWQTYLQRLESENKSRDAQAPVPE